jgi:Cd2+/Zn2+-exporting ATPase
VAELPAETAETAVYVAKGGRYLGAVYVADVLKHDAADAIRTLRLLGVKRAMMLTGDREEVAASLAERAGVGDYRASLLPDGKVCEVEALLSARNRRGAVVFVGDGINDAPVLARADVGVAMGALGPDAAIEAADVVLMDDSLSSLVRALRIARKTVGIARQNIVFAVSVKVAVMLLAAFGYATMWLAVFADVGVAVLAILNAMRTMRPIK